jgi:acyl dehydratase
MRLAVPLVRKAATSASGPATTVLLNVGDALRSGRRRFTEADVAAYAAVSGDRNAVHLDDAFARGTGGFARGRVVHGMLAASLFPALIASRFVRIPVPSPPLSLRDSAEHSAGMTSP